MGTEIVYKMPQWGKYLLIVLVLAITGGFLYLGINYKNLMPNEPKFIRYFFYLVSIIGLVSTYRLITWKTIIYFKASRSGMYFPCPLLKNCDSEYLFVAWEHIKNIKLGLFRNSTVGSGPIKGVSVDVKISLEERNQFFPGLLLNKKQEWETVGFTDIFLNKKKAINQLNAMKSKNENT